MLNSLDLMGKLDSLSETAKKDIINWVYGLHLRHESHDHALGFVGFEGGFSNRWQCDAGGCSVLSGHLAMTYAAICCLIILGDDLTRVDAFAIGSTMKALQLPSGIMMAHGPEAEADVRFLYSALAVIELLQLPASTIDLKTAKDYILSCQAFDGGFGLCPGWEAHGGATYCSIASLGLIAKIQSREHTGADGIGGFQSLFCSQEAEARAVRWLSMRQRDLQLSDNDRLRKMALDLGVATWRAQSQTGPTISAPVPPSTSLDASNSALPSVKSTASEQLRDESEVAEHSDASEQDDDDDEEEDERPLSPKFEVMLAGPGGLTGRPGKCADTCYSYWVGASLEILRPPMHEYINSEDLHAFVLSCQFPKGGFCKDCEALPDPMHTYCAIAGLGLSRCPGVQSLDPLLGLSARAAAAWRALYAK
jgi:prenyltransferase beta subunit